MPPLRSDADVAVVGAGPAGLAAAVTAAENGARVLLIDGENGPGGQFWRQSTVPGRSPRDGLYHGLRRFRRLCDRLAAAQSAGSLEYLAGHQVWALERSAGGFVLRITAGIDGGAGGATGALIAGAATVVLATGAYDLPLPFPGWDLAGVLTAGGVQALLKGHDVVAGRRVLVAGTGPFLLPVATGLARSGATVVGVHEAAAPTRWLRGLPAVARSPGKLGEGAGYARDLLRHRVPYRTRSTVLAADGDARLHTVTTARLDRQGRPIPGSRHRIEVDILAVGWGFVPQLDLPLALGCTSRPDPNGIAVIATDDDQRTNIPGVLVAGEACGIGGAALAEVEGTIAGGTAAGATAPAAARRARRALRAFAAAMHRAHPVPAHWIEQLADDTVVCRCEEITAAALREVADRDGATDARTAKLLARSGLGWCQGRMCSFATGCLLAAAGGVPADHRPVPRPVAAPIRLGEVAGQGPSS